jgi:HEAT repeat protein
VSDSEFLDLIGDLNHTDEHIRQRALEKLESLGGAAVQPLVDHFDRIEGAARLHVIRIFGQIGDPCAVPLLLELMAGDDPGEYIFVSSMAARSLRQIGDETAVEGLVEMLRHERSGLRQMAATVLGNIGSPQAVPGLICALSHSDPQTCALSARSLEKIGTPQAMEAVVEWRGR